MGSKNYGIMIKEMDQPLLMHRPKERSKQQGKVEPLSVTLNPHDSQLHFFSEGSVTAASCPEFLHQSATLWLHKLLHQKAQNENSN